MTQRARRLSTFGLGSLLGLLVAVLALPAFQQPACAQEAMAAAIRERIKTRPNDATLYYYLSYAEIQAGNKAAGLEALEQVARVGKGFLPVRRFGFDSVWTDTSFQRIRGQLERKLPRVTAARELFRLDKSLIPEGITYDPTTRSYFVGSIAAAKIVRIDSSGSVSDWSRPGEVDQVLGLAIDGRARRLHAVSTRALVTSAPPGNRIVTFDLDSGASVRSVEIPGAGQLNDVAVGPGGDLYTTDSRAGAVFRIRADGAIDTTAAPGTIPGANGLVVSPDGAALYIAHGTGVARLELGSRALLPRLELPAGESLAAIDGLYADRSTLIGIQNVTNPGRVVRIHLRADGKGADRIETLLSHHHPAIDEPTTGVVVGRSFALLATTQVGRFTDKGTIESPETVKPPVVLRVDLDRAPRRN